MASSYLVIHKITFYNDEFYIDFTGVSGFANPVELHSSRAEAELAVRRLTREAVRGGYWYDFKPDLETLGALATVSQNPNVYGVSRDAFNEVVFSTDLSDEQLDQFIAALGIRLFYILEAGIPEKAAHRAEMALQQTHERPQ